MSYRNPAPVRKPRSTRGFVLVEATTAMAIMTILGLILLKLSLNILYPRQWALHQTLSDAYLTYERAYAQRVPFETLTGDGSPWPVYPTTTSTTVELGKLPGERPVTGTVVRFRVADAVNDAAVLNPAGLVIWKVQSVLSYRIGERTYVKSRTVVRAQ